jgi:hypothetical protein
MIVLGGLSVCQDQLTARFPLMWAQVKQILTRLGEQARRKAAARNDSFGDLVQEDGIWGVEVSGAGRAAS